MKGRRHVVRLIRLIQNALSPDLLKGQWRQPQRHPMAGHCYVAAEALYHLLGRDGLKPCCASYPGGTHWWLEDMRTGRRLDPTAGQFPNGAPYQFGRGNGFLTRQPSKRAQVVIGRVRGTQ